MKASHVQRWLTAIVAVPALFFLIFLGSEWSFALLIGAVIVLASWEYEGLIIRAGEAKRRWEFLLTASLIPALTWSQDHGFLVVSVALLIMVLVFCELFRIRNDRGMPDTGLLARYILGLIYIPLLMSMFIFIRGLEQGTWWVFFVLAVAFAGDVAAFYTGKFLGRTKLMPAVSPNKTVEGVVGLVLGGTIAAVGFRFLFFPEMALGHFLIMGFFGSMIGQLGDLFESLIKRGSGVKDSGSLLPGHGGVLDRIDCLLFIGPFVYFYRAYIMG